MVGQPAAAVIEKLGYPTEDRVIAGNKVYIWASSNFVEGTNYGCHIRAIVDAHDIISTWDYGGNVGGCQMFASRLGR